MDIRIFTTEDGGPVVLNAGAHLGCVPCMLMISHLVLPVYSSKLPTYMALIISKSSQS